MLLTVAGQLPIHTAFPILPASDDAGHLCYDEYIKRMPETQRVFLSSSILTLETEICKLFSFIFAI
jgi:hypothetical protein